MKKIAALVIAALLLLGCTANQGPTSSTPATTSTITPTTGGASWSGWPWKNPAPAIQPDDFGADTGSATIYARAVVEARLSRTHFSVIKPSSWVSAYRWTDQYADGHEPGKGGPGDADGTLDYAMLYPVELTPSTAPGIQARAEASYFSVISTANPSTDSEPLHGASITLDALPQPAFRTLASQAPRTAMANLKKAAREFDALAGIPSSIEQSGTTKTIQERALTVSGAPAYEITQDHGTYTEVQLLVIPGPDAAGLYAQLFYGNANAYPFQDAKSAFDQVVQTIQPRP